MKFLLDTNICIYVIKKRPADLVARFHKYKIADLTISSITLSELEYGIQKSSYPVQNRVALYQFLAPIEVVQYDSGCAHYYGIIRKSLEDSGKTIGPMDMLIAAHCLSLDYTLVTNNEKEFMRIPDLRVENWVKA